LVIFLNPGFFNLDCSVAESSGTKYQYATTTKAEKNSET